MNYVQKLKAAIERLEALRREGTTAEGWSYAPDDDGVRAIVGDAGGMNYGLFTLHADGCLRRNPDRPSNESITDAELIVTLHRSIDAQLAILRVALAYEKSLYGTRVAEEFHRKVLALADAILGEEAR